MHDSEDVKRVALWGVMKYLDAAEIYCRVLPSGKADEHRGMARVLDVEQMLRLYAVNNPEQDLVLKVTDDWIPENTGIYVIGKGDCVCDNAKAGGGGVVRAGTDAIAFRLPPGTFSRVGALFQKM